MLTQGRGLGIAAIVASQDYAGIMEADKKGAQQMVANTSIKIFMKMQDAEKTWDLIRGQAGQSTVLRTSGFNINEQISSDYRDANSTTVEQEDRVVLRDLQEQIEGEAHFVFSGQIVRGDMFFANPSLKKAQLRRSSTSDNFLRRNSMTMRHNIILAQVLSFCCLIGLCHTAFARTPMSDRVARGSGRESGNRQDLASPYSRTTVFPAVTCLDGRPVDGFEGDILEYWSNLEWCAV